MKAWYKADVQRALHFQTHKRASLSKTRKNMLKEPLTPIDQQERKTYDFDGDETKTGSARLVVYVGAM